MEKSTELSAASIGSTVVATVLTFVIVGVVSSVAAVIISLAQYYLGNVREEAAIFIGNVMGGVISVYAARYSNDTILKSYSPRSVAIVFWLISVAMAAFYLFVHPLNGDTIYRFAFIVPSAAAFWFIFWHDPD